MLSGIMTLLRFLFGNAQSIKGVAEVFFGNKKERDAQSAANEHDEQIEIHREHAAGYSYAAPTRNWFDSLIDGINRLPRPIFAFLAIWLIVWACWSPAAFIVSMKALNQVPEWVSTFVTIVLIFFFGSRTIAKDIPEQVAAARKLGAMNKKEAARSASTDDESMMDQWRGFVK